MSAQTDQNDQQQQHDDANLGDAGKRALAAERDARTAAERRAKQAEDRVRELETAAARREVATAKGLSDAQAKHLTGASREELEASADELLDAFGAKPDNTSRNRRPAERLRPGAAPDDEPEPDPAKMADQIRARGSF